MPVHLRTALVHGSALIPLVENGLGALVGGDVAVIAVVARPCVGESLDLDEAMRETHPNTHRWDYLLSLPDSNEIVGLEPHQAKDSEISVVIGKKQQAVTYLLDHLRQGHKVKRWIWVSHGRVRFGVMERARKRLDKNGITFEGRQLRSF